MNDILVAIQRMKSIADMLVPYTFPEVSIEEEKEVACLKQAEFCIDGYRVVLAFSRSKYENHLLDTLQIQSANGWFLPFNLVCKLGELFLGSKNLAYIDFFRRSRKVYCWAVKTSNDCTVPPGNKTKEASFDGFNFRVLDAGSLSFD